MEITPEYLKFSTHTALPLEESNLHVVVLYEDKGSKDRAARFCDRMSHLVSVGRPQVSWWMSTMLRQSALRRLASDEIANADVIIVSVGARGEWPEELVAQGQHLLTGRRRGAGCLVLLADPPASGSHGQSRLSDHIEEVARIAHLNCVSPFGWVDNQREADEGLGTGTHDRLMRSLFDGVLDTSTALAS